MIEVEHLTKYYGDSPAIRDINFSVAQGEILGFLGPNGAGKTTTMRIITGYLPPTSGKVTVAGFDVAEKSLDARRHLGYLPETVPLYTDLTTYEYLDFRGRICGLKNGRDRKARIYDVMDELNIGDVSKKLIGKLSRGYRQRVGLAQALLHNPDVLILDEPTVGLDPIQITEVRNLIKELGRNHTIILSTHLLPEVSMVCNRVIIVSRGRLAALDTPLHLAQGASESSAVEVQVRGEPASVLNTLTSVPGVRSASQNTDPVGHEGSVAALAAEARLPEGAHVYRVESQPGNDLRPNIASAVIGAGFDLLELHGLVLSLEDVFLQIVTREAEQEEPVDEYGDGGQQGEAMEGPEPVKQRRRPVRASQEEDDTASEEEEPVAAASDKSVRIAARRPRK